MPISGRFAIDAEFSDTAESGITKNTKRLSLKGADAYTTGSVAIVSGTCSTSSIASITISSVAYTDSSGSPVSFSSVRRVAFQGQPNGQLSMNTGGAIAYSRDGEVSVVSQPLTAQSLNVRPFGTVASASFTLLLYGT